MSTHSLLHRTAPKVHAPSTSSTMAATATEASVAGRALALLRIGVGFTFLWAFVDKTFGFNYATPSAKSWINGGSPTKGFLSGVETGPFQSFYHSIAGTWWANTFFMLGLLGIGVALILGVGLRAAAVAGTILLLMMWFAEFPLAQHTATGDATGSPNPLVDAHVMDALALIVVAATNAGTTWGLGRMWARLPFVQQHPSAL